MALLCWCLELHLDAIENIISGFFMRCVGLSSDALPLLKPEKTIGYRIVMAVSPLAHAADYIDSLQQALPIRATEDRNF